MRPDVMIVYERKNRELENSVLLKLELERRGYDCVISSYYEGRNFNFFNKGASILVVPYLYDDKSVTRNIVRFGKPKQILNLQYEQVLSEKWEKLGHHNPKGEACKGIHVCWGEETEQRMRKAGVPVENIVVPGPIHTDLLRREFRTPRDKVRSELALSFGLDEKKKWVLFLSSFSYANITEERLKLNEKVSGSKLADFVKIHTESRNEIIDWFRDALPDSDINFIYRPHPDEENLQPVLKMEEQYENFYVINHASAKKWIECSDKIYSWYSTTVVEAHILNIPYSILRPFALPEYFDSVLLKKARFITSKDQFLNNFNGLDEAEGLPLSPEDVEAYYKVGDIPSYLKLSNIIESMLEGKSVNFKLPFWYRLFFKFRSYGALMVFYLYVFSPKYLKKLLRGSGSFFDRWFLELDNHLASKEEVLSIEEDLKRKLLQYKRFV